jgi:hypothetical protein
MHRLQVGNARGSPIDKDALSLSLTRAEAAFPPLVHFRSTTRHSITAFSSRSGRPTRLLDGQPLFVMQWSKR